jgi:hypothetical protein
VPEGAGYVERIREPHWQQHRMFNSPEVETTLHVFRGRIPRSTACWRSATSCAAMTDLGSATPKQCGSSHIAR